MEKIKRNVLLDFLGKQKKLDIVKSEYYNNGKLYLGLICKNWEPFSDITVNDPSVICYNCEHLVDRDFINFGFNWDVEKCNKRLQENLNTSPLEYRGNYYSFIL